jgi:hypothetical protein
MEVCKIAAKSLVQSKKQKARIYASKAQINSVVMQMRNQLGLYFLFKIVQVELITKKNQNFKNI